MSTGLRLLPFFGMPMIISPLAGALSDKIGRRPVMVTGLALLTAGFTWVAVRGSLTTSWVELTLALLVSGIGISMALPTVPTAVLNAVAPDEMGKASGINYMAQRLGGVFAIAISTAVFTANGHLGTPASVTSGFKPALAACAGFALLATLSATAITSHTVPASLRARRARAIDSRLSSLAHVSRSCHLLRPCAEHRLATLAAAEFPVPRPMPALIGIHEL